MFFWKHARIPPESQKLWLSGDQRCCFHLNRSFLCLHSCVRYIFVRVGSCKHHGKPLGFFSTHDKKAISKNYYAIYFFEAKCAPSGAEKRERVDVNHRYYIKLWSEKHQIVSLDIAVLFVFHNRFRAIFRSCWGGCCWRRQ